MGMKSRNKGKVGEREIASIVRALTGWEVKRKVRQLDGESDLEGIPGFCVEVKRHATATRGDLKTWWAQAVEQAIAEKKVPLLFFRKNQDEWRAVWPIGPLIGVSHGGTWHDYEWTIEGSIVAWSTVAAEIINEKEAA
jgi:hypothetical protein